MNIGRIIKQLRKEKNVTQEKLADYLGLSCQAISRWENNLSDPETSLLPSIANYFNVSIDYLFNFDSARKIEKINTINKQYSDAVIKGDVKSRIEIMENAVFEFPNQYDFLYNLVDSYLSVQRMQEDKLLKARTICIRILEDCTEDTVRQKTLAALATVYNLLGDGVEAITIANKLPILEYSKEYILPRVENEANSIYFTQSLLLKNILKIGEDLENIAFRKDYHLEKKLSANDKIMFIEKANNHYRNFIDEDNCFVFHQRFAWNYRRLGELYLVLEDEETAVHYYELSKKHSKAYDTLKDNTSYTSIFFNKLQFSRDVIQKNWEGSESGMLYYRLKEMKNNFKDPSLLSDLFKALKNFENEVSL